MIMKIKTLENIKILSIHSGKLLSGALSRNAYTNITLPIHISIQ